VAESALLSRISGGGRGSDPPNGHGPTLTVAAADFVQHGVRPSRLRPAIAELEALGFIEVVGLDEAGVPNRFRLSDGWRAIKTAKKAVAAKHRAQARWGRASPRPTS
jgi:hypothetical protein